MSCTPLPARFFSLAAAAAWAEIAQIAGSDGDIQILGGQARTLLLSQRTDEALKLLETHPLDASLTEELLSGALPGDGLHALSFSEGDLGIWDGWLMLQRARQRCERGELSGCRDDATRAATPAFPFNGWNRADRSR